MKKTIRYTSFALVLVALLIIPLFASCSASGNYANDEAYPELDYSKDENYEGGVSYAPDGSLTTDNAVLSASCFISGEMAGIKISEHNVKALFKQIVLNILIKMEIPDKVQHEDILGDHVDGGDGFVSRYGL